MAAAGENEKKGWIDWRVFWSADRGDRRPPALDLPATAAHKSGVTIWPDIVLGLVPAYGVLAGKKLGGVADHTVHPTIAKAAYKRQRRNEGVTELKTIPNRGHALTIDSGWREVAQTALDFVKRLV